MSVPLPLVRQRDGDRCIRCGQAQNLHVHHRCLRSRGGPDTFPNLVTLCSDCHYWVHHHVAEATSQGWLVASWDDPADIPVRHWLWPAGPVRLLDEGTFGLS